MILKKIILTGFKSFPDKTEFEFGEGVTCVVGPNGCGKSNIVDAVKWVLGEQSAKSLRGNQMMDMIFNGSSSRRSSGMAQVDLVFDNQDQTLGLPQSEVAVSRRLYRSGESEYLLNKETCRLKDVREMFWDTGVGTDAYSVIEQGKVDVLLQSNPQQRRMIFEEAAGISKYKARRKEAERKLERTQQNLLRIQDLFDELERRLRSVKLQAGKARSFQSYDHRLRELRASYALAEYHRHTRDHARITAEVSECTDHSVALQADLARRDTEDSALSTRVMELDRTIERSSQEAADLQSQITALEERLRSAGHRQTEQQEMCDGHRQRADQERSRLEKLQRTLDDEQSKLPALEAESTEQASRVGDLTDQDQKLARNIAELQVTLEDEKSGVIELLRRSSELHNEITGLDVHSESLADQKNRLQARDGEIRGQLEDLLERKAAAQHRLAEIQSLIERETQRLAEKKAAAGENSNARQSTARQLSELKEQRSALRSQEELLKDLEHRMEGVDGVVRHLLQRKAAEPDNPRLSAILGMVADVITTDMQHAPVIEAALERWAQHLIVDHSESFLALNGELGQLKGRLHVLCTDRLNPVMDGRCVTDSPGVVGRAIDLVKFPEKLEYLTRHILGKTVVVESFEHALALAREDVHGYEFVTLEGQVVDGCGRMAIGLKSEHTGLVARKSRLREIATQLRDIDIEIDVHSNKLNHQEAEHAHLENLIQDLRTAVYENHAARVESEAALRHAVEGIERLAQEQPRITGEVQRIEQQINLARERASKSKESLDQLQEQNDRRHDEIQSYHQRIEQLTDERNRVLAGLTESRVAAGQLAEKKTAVQEAVYAVESALESARRALDDHIEQIAQCERRIAESQQAAETCRQELARLSAALEEHQSQTLQWRHQREALRLDGERLAEQTKSLRSNLSAVEEQIHSAQMRLQEAALRRDELCGRVQEELGIELAEAYQSYEDQQQDWEAVEAEIQELRAKIGRLGNINLDAIQEQQELEDRLGFLNDQRQDLDDSRRQLEELIDRLNTESRERFLKTFEEVRAHFQELFRKLFGGGKADLALDPTSEDVLEAGVDIFARPPGKELQSISLLSGGEKTLTAIALLLGIFRTRPSPFVLLDEVDAALDEANNERFNRIVRDFLDQSQFIIITHSKRTMHIADTLYGVTMQEAGVSRRVGVRFDDQAEDEDSDSAVA